MIGVGRKRQLIVAGCLAAAACATGLGWRWTHPQENLQPNSLNESVTFDEWGRLAAYPGKQAAPCPLQDEHTIVILAIGQSNAGNHGALRYMPRHGTRVLNYYEGRCFLAASPLLGASGRAGDYWGMLGDALIDAGRARQVVVLPFAVGGSRIDRWRPDGDLHRPLLYSLGEVKKSYHITHVLVHQGETDFLQKTSQLEYRKSLLMLATTLRHAGIAAPLYVTVASRCLLVPWTPSNAIAMAQREAVDVDLGIVAGPDADAVWGPRHRFDDCHLSGEGQATMAERWAELLR